VEIEYSFRFYSFFSEHLLVKRQKRAAKHVGKAALEAGKTAAVDASKNLSIKQCSQIHQIKKVEDIMSKAYG